jgi:DNA-binding NtrC family response regulator
LIQHFFQVNGARHGKKLGFEKNVLAHLLDYHWPGNIRELENVVERLVVLAENIVTESDVLRCLDDMTEASSRPDKDLEQIKREHIFKVLAECGGNKTLAAQRLGMSRTHLWRILKAPE